MAVRLFALLLCILLIFSQVVGAKEKEKEYLVTKVLDGDTIVLEHGETVRYLGVDTPELGKKNGGPEFYSREAIKFNKQMVLFKKVRLEFDVEQKDGHGRTLAYVYVKKAFINADLVRLGYARAMIKPPNVKHKDLLLRYQKEAMEKELGLWQEKKVETESHYIGNKRSYVLHKPSCPQASKMPEKNRIIFRNRLDPIKIGYTPCRRCRP